MLGNGTTEIKFSGATDPFSRALRKMTKMTKLTTTKFTNLQIYKIYKFTSLRPHPFQVFRTSASVTKRRWGKVESSLLQSSLQGYQYQDQHCTRTVRVRVVRVRKRFCYHSCVSTRTREVRVTQLQTVSSGTLVKVRCTTLLVLAR